MPISKMDFADVLRSLPPDVSDEQLDQAVKLRQAGFPATRLWEALNRPLALAPDSYFAQHEHAPDEGMGRRSLEGLASTALTPATLLTTATGVGGSMAGARGMLGISKGARYAEAAMQVPMIGDGLRNMSEAQDFGQGAVGAAEALAGAYFGSKALDHSFPMGKVAKAYAKSKGIDYDPARPQPTLVPEERVRIANTYHEMPQTPGAPETQTSYRALGKETEDQFRFLTERAGVKFELFHGEGEPYANSAEMLDDLRRNNRLLIKATDSGFGEAGIEGAPDHPMLQRGENGELLNDQFRFVHDAMGHGPNGFGFGPKGEEGAYLEHAKLFSPEARRALATETRGQINWTNYGPHMQDEYGNLLTPDDPRYLPQGQRPFAEQKVGLLPEHLSRPQIPPPLDNFTDPQRGLLRNGESWGILSAENPGRQVLPDETNAALTADLVQRTRGRGIPQIGKFDAEERSVLIPGMTADQTENLGRAFEQESVISSQGYSRLADKARFPIQGMDVVPEADNYYSRLDVPGQGEVKYQLDIPSEAFEPAPTKSPIGGSTAMAIASPAAAHSGYFEDDPNDPNDDWKQYAKVGLDVAGAAGAASAMAQAGWFPKDLGERLNTLERSMRDAQKLEFARKNNAQSWSELPPAVKKKFSLRDAEIDTAVKNEIRKVATSYDHEQQLLGGREVLDLSKATHGGLNWDERRPFTQVLAKDAPGTSTTGGGRRERGVKLSDWSQKRMDLSYELGAQRASEGAHWGDARWLYHLSNGDPDKAVAIARLFGAFSPGQKTDMNAFNGVEAFSRVLSGEDPEDIMASLVKGHPRPTTVIDNFKRAVLGGRIFADKTEALAGAELGRQDRIPIDMWLLRALGVNTDTTPSKGTYRLVSEAISKAAAAKGENPFSYMAKVWMGIQTVAGNESPSFAEGVANLRLPGHLGDPENAKAVANNLHWHAQQVGAAKAATKQGQLHVGAVSPIATNPRMSFEDFQQATADILRKTERTDVLGKQSVPQTDEPITLHKLIQDERDARQKWVPYHERVAAAAKETTPLADAVKRGPEAPDVRLKKIKAGDGVAHRMVVGKKVVGTLSGFERDGTFHLYKTGLVGERGDPGSVHGTGAYQRAVQQVADQYPNGLFVHDWEASPALKKALAKLPTFSKDGDKLRVTPSH